MATEQKVILEGALNHSFLDEIKGLPGGDQVKNCIQCGTCSGTCPSSHVMDYSPRRIFSMIRAGMREEVLSSNTIWKCASCYSCLVLCPKEIKIADIFYSLKRLAIKEGKQGKNKAAVLSSSFASMVDKYGRNSETRLLVKYFLRADLFGWVAQLPVGWKLLSRGRLPLTAKRIKGVKEIRAITEKVREIQSREEAEQ